MQHDVKLGGNKEVKIEKFYYVMLQYPADPKKTKKTSRIRNRDRGQEQPVSFRMMMLSCLNTNESEFPGSID